MNQAQTQLSNLEWDGVSRAHLLDEEWDGISRVEAFLAKQSQPQQQPLRALQRVWQSVMCRASSLLKKFASGDRP